ncbi:MAG: 2-amino-4-hydroxy-6-hydroxymethyldihydropteridine diphosphokinase [Bacteroidota bacterium]
MKLQNQAVLSIGSNQGNRLENLIECIDLIHNKVATVIQVSSYYETPSWGFESDAFYNVSILIHTNKSAQELLKELLEIEIRLGRIRNDQQGYQSRIIDVDIVSFNNEIIATENLTVPHPQMQNRLFVLLPMNDLKIDYVHPVLKVNLSDLIKNCEDKSDCTAIGNLKLPLSTVELSKMNYIVIEGNIGAGKTTLTNKIAEDFNAKIIVERFAENPFLPKFYKDQNRYAFSLEMSFLADRYQQLSDDLAKFDLQKDFVVADYHIFKSLIFAEITLPKDEFQLYKQLFEIIYKEIKKPDLYVYLYQNTSSLLDNIKKRGRTYEQEIQPDYLDKINEGYLKYITNQKNLNVLMIDITNKDFVNNQEDYVFILEEIRIKMKP